MNIASAHRLTVFLVAAWGYTALLLTGEFNSAILIAAYVLAIAAYVFHLRRFALPTWFWNGISILALVVTFGMASRQLLDATVYLFTFLQVVKLFTARTPNEMRWCYVISLFHIIGASVLTTSMSFGILFLGYILLMVFSLLLYTLHRESEVTERLAENLALRRISQFSSRVTLPRIKTPWALTTSTPRGLVWTSAILAVFVLIGSLITFALVPRLQTQNLFQGYGKPPEEPALSAFDESIEFGTFERIQLDSAVALYVQPLEKKIPDHVRLRGVALDSFDGKAWRRTSVSDYSMGVHTFTPFTTKLHPTHVRYRMIQPPGVTNFLFADTFPQSITVPREVSYYVDPFSGSAWLGTMFPKEFQYTSESRLERLEDRRDPAEEERDRRAYVLNPRRDERNRGPNPGWHQLMERRSQQAGEHRLQENTDTSEMLRSSDSERQAEDVATTAGSRMAPDTLYPRYRNRRTKLQDYLDLCTSVPRMLNTNSIRNLAREWASDSTTSFGMAMAIEQRFRTQFGYTLEPQSRGNFIEDFLFRTREGHCEYFATSMAILCRHLGLPARVVNGYYTVEWNTIGGNFTVRQRDAHSWVEVWLSDDYGWMTFDPTPPVGVGRPETRNPLVIGLTRLNDALRVRWYRYVVDYSINDQAAIMRTLLSMREKINKAFSRLQKLSPFTDSAEQSEDSAPEESGILSLVGTAALAVLLAIGVVAWLRRLQFRRRRRAECMVRYYAELLRLLSRRGIRLQSGQTPRELAEQVASTHGMELFVPITEYYYGSRYLGQDLTPAQAELVARFKRLLQGKTD